MQFANPLMLVGLLVVAIPLIIALLNRQRHREVRWAAMAFLEAALKKNKRRLTFQNVLLLLLRTAILLLLVLALARPFLEDSSIFTQATKTNRQIVLMIDRSFSMGHRPGTELSSLDRAKEAVSEILRHYARAGDQLQLYLVDETAEAQYRDPKTLDGGTKEEVLRDLADLEPSSFATDMARSIRTVLQSLEEEEPAESGGRTEIFLLTDMQRGAWAREIGLRDPGLPVPLRKFAEAKGLLRIVDVGSEGRENLAVHAFAPSDSIVTPSVPVRLDAVVKSYASFDKPGVQVDLLVDGMVRASLSQTVPGGKQTTFPFHHVFADPGSHSVTARLAADHLALDNERHLALIVRERVPVLVVDGDPQDDPWKSESDFLSAALSPAGGDAPGERPLLEVTVITESDLGREPLGPYAVVVLANVASLTADQARTLERYVETGGGLLVSLGDQIDPRFYRESLYRDGEGLLPAAPGEIQGDPDDDVGMELDIEDLSHPALRFFEPEGREPALQNNFFNRYYSVTAVAPGGRALLGLVRRTKEEGGERLEKMGPVLLEKAFGRGRVMLWASTLDGAWSSFPPSWTYVALMQLIAIYLSDTESVQKNLLVGDPYQQLIPAAFYTDQVKLVTPTQETISKPLTRGAEGDGHFRLYHESCRESGIYLILFSRGETEAAREEHFAVNVRTEESDLRPIDFDELKDLLPGAPLAYTPSQKIASLTGSAAKAGGAAGMWMLLLFLLIGFLAIETILARVLGR